jgi:proline iminopeptidase
VDRLRDATRLALVVLATLVARRAVRPLGDEAQRPLAGDELVPKAGLRWTHGITISGRPAEIWPWLVQMGCRRAGWYSYDALDNGGVPSAESIIPELQRAEVGDVFPMTPTADDGFVVRAVEPGRALVLGDPTESATWAFALAPVDQNTTRLIARVRAVFDHFALGLLFSVLWRPIHFGMQRRQLLNLKRLVEGTAGEAS